jgi:hypothetical protein
MADGLVHVAERVFGVNLYPRQRELLAGLERTPNAVWACGRRGGKTTLAAIVALYDLLFRPDLDALVQPGEPRYSVCVATNREQGRVLLRSAKLIVERSRPLRRWLESENEDELVFNRDGRRLVLKVFPCSSRGLRGFAISSAVMDEAAFYVTTEDGDRAAAQVYQALRPATAQFGHAGRFLAISSPCGEVGWFAEMWGKAYRGELAGWEAQQASTAEMNPRVPSDYLAQLERDEPDTYGAEYMALFESGGNAFFDMSRFAPDPALEPAAPEGAAVWVAGIDPAFSSDAFGCALIGRGAAGRLVVGPIEAVLPERRRGWSFELKREATDRVLSRVADVCRRYSAYTVSDQHESQTITARLQALGVNASVTAMTRETKLAAFRELRDRLYDGSLVLPDHPDLFDELRRVRLKLEQGGAKIILPRSSKGHCDMVQALAVAVYESRHAGAPAQEVIMGRSPWAGYEDQLEPWRVPGGTLTGGLLTDPL